MKRISDFNFNGQSMFPVFKPGDGVIVVKDISIDTFRVGDVICFRPQGYEHSIIHRIVNILPTGIITRGDNNSENDQFLITKKYDPQLVTGIRRGNRTIKIYGGKLGYLNQKKVLFFKVLRKTFKSSLKILLD